MSKKIERLFIYLKAKNIKPTLAERKAGLGGGLITRSKREDKDLTEYAVERLCAAFPDLNEEWLNDGKGEMLLATPRAISISAGDNNNIGGVNNTNSDSLDKALESLRLSQMQLSKSQEQIDRLLSLLESEKEIQKKNRSF